jgi:hypothetical protein
VRCPRGIRNEEPPKKILFSKGGFGADKMPERGDSNVLDDVGQKCYYSSYGTVYGTGEGAFGVLNKGKYYVEYIDLFKLLEDARARNTSFFRQLGLE